MDRAINQGQGSVFRRLLLRWYGKNQRKLPWRGESDPYRILVSEIMLQQTRVAVVEERYRMFIRQFPTAKALARSREQTVLAAWSGLGYYRRARALHRAAREIVRQGAFPRSADSLAELPGVGRYTAAAVGSIAFGEPVAVVDGNVKRVLDRVFHVESMPEARFSQEQYWDLAGQLLDKRRAGDFNQAMMELGALVCLPDQPLCRKCPVAKMCSARGPIAGKERTARRKAVLHYALVRRDPAVLLQKRPMEESLMPGMWELPSLNGELNAGNEPLLKLRHSITTTDYTVMVHAVARKSVAGCRWVRLDSAKRLPLTGLTRKILGRISDV
ncbi:MAG TPA: A/G-specific adenine glycosylase [Candidatus Angelobacter sp.]|nr:A/G-specific adenine glycosylase [Candidatus Angelobacter sp.]